MKTQFRTTFAVIFILLTFIVSLFTPFSALADGTSTPPPTNTTTTDTPAATQATSTSAPATTAAPTNATQASTATTDTPAPTATTDTPAPATTIAPTDATQAPTITDTPVPSVTAAPTDATPSATSTATATATATALAQVPSGTQVVAVDNSGAVQPLATQAAANIIATGDPIWCPAGASPVAGTGGCTSSYSNLYNLVTYLSSNQPTSNGTIWITSGADSSTSNISMNGGSLTTWANYALTFQGGWNGSSAGTITGTSDFTNAYISITGWKNDLTANDLTFNGSAGNNLDLETSGNIRVHHVTSKNAYNDGVYLNNTSGTGKSITVDGTNNFSNNNNHGSGIEAYSNGDISLSNVIADGNHINGAILGNGGTSLNNVNLSGTNEFNTNGSAGISIYSSGVATLNNITADNNSGNNGLYIDNTFFNTGSGVTLTGTNEFNNNHGTNIAMWSTGDITINNLSASNSVTGDGAYIDTTHATSGAPSVTLTGANVFDGNNGNGLWVVAKGAISASNVTADNNKIGDGVYLDNKFGSGGISIDNGTFSANGITTTNGGLTAYSNGDITLNNVIASDNGGDGAYLDNTSGSGGISINNGNLSANGTTTTGRGLIAHSNGDITLNNVIAIDNAGGGAELDNTTGNGSITLSGSNTFNDNGFNLAPSVGLYAVSNDNITLSGVTALGNGYGEGGGAFLGTDGGSVSIANSNFSENCTTCDIGVGFVVFSIGNGDITLQGVTADNNGNDPANGYTGSAAAVGALILHNGGNVFVANSDFSGNCALGDCFGGGIEILDLGTGGTVSFDHVTANGNGTSNSGGGAFIASTGNIDIHCSTFNNNSGTGLLADIPGGSTITLNGVTLSGNTVSATDISGGGTLVTNTGNCASGSKGTVGGGLPLNVINVNSGESNALDCTNFSGTELVLPNQDYVLLPCPTTGNATLTNKANNDLPNKLNSKYTFISAFDVEVVPSSNGSLIVSFKIPSDKQNANFTILHWDGAKWVDIGGSKTPDGFFRAQTNLTGTFVLVTQ